MAHKHLLEPILNAEERAVLNMKMARVAYVEWAELGGISPDYDALSAHEKMRWERAIRVAVRAMVGLMGHMVAGEDDEHG